jgi:hypothetical protein
MRGMDTPRERLRTLADAYAPDRPDRSLLGDLVVAWVAVLHVLLVAGPRGIWWVLTGRGGP